MKNLSFLVSVVAAILGIALTQLTKCNTVPTSNTNYSEVVEALNCTIDSLMNQSQAGDTNIVILPALQEPVKYITRILTKYKFDTVFVNSASQLVPTPIIGKGYIADPRWGGQGMLTPTPDTTTMPSLDTTVTFITGIDTALLKSLYLRGDTWKLRPQPSPVYQPVPTYIEYNDEWVSLMATKDLVNTNISLSVKDSLVQTVSVHRKWFLGRKHYTVITKSANPYSIIQQQTFIFDRKSIRR